MKSPLVSVVVNYFNPTGSECLSSMVVFSLRLLKENTSNRLELILADGSGSTDSRLESLCTDNGWVYAASDAPEAFARSYNRGMMLATGDFKCWMASDILVAEKWDALLVSEMQRTGAWMAAPFLTLSDYPGQLALWVFGRRTFMPSSMTINLNMLTKRAVEVVGLLDERFSGTFNDIDYLLRIRKLGGEAIIVDAGAITHLSRSTLQVATMVDGSRDSDAFLRKYPMLRTKVATWQYDEASALLCRSVWFRVAVRFATWIGGRSGRLRRVVLRFEPAFHGT